MKRTFTTLLAALCIPFSAYCEFEHKFGFGFHYWKTVDQIDGSDIEEDGLAMVFAYELDGGLLSLQAEVERFPDNYGGSSEAVYAPQALAKLGESIYAAIGIGTYYSDGDFADDHFYLARAGIELAAFGPIALDINANYYFADFSSFNEEEIDSDTVTLGAMLKVAL